MSILILGNCECGSTFEETGGLLLECDCGTLNCCNCFSDTKIENSDDIYCKKCWKPL